MRPHSVLTSLRYVGLTIGFIMFVFMAYRASQTANSRIAVQGKPHIVTAPMVQASSPMAAAVQASTYGAAATVPAQTPTPTVQTAPVQTSPSPAGMDPVTESPEPVVPVKSTPEVPPGQLKKHTMAAIADEQYKVKPPKPNTD